MEMITFRCDQCQQVLRVGADKAGLQAKCPRCSKNLLIPSASTLAPAQDEGYAPPRPRARGEEPAPIQRYEEDRPRGRPDRRARDEEDDYDDRPRRRGEPRDEDDQDDYDEGDRPRRRRAPGKIRRWPKVRVGLLIVAIAAMVFGGTFVGRAIGDILWVIAVTAGKPGPANAAVTIYKIVEVLAFMAALTAVVGYVFLIFAPAKNGALGLGIGVLIAGVVNLVLRLVFILLPFFDHGVGLFTALGVFPFYSSPGGSLVVWILLPFLFAAEFILVALFLRAVALSFKERWHAQGCMNLIFLAGGIALALLVEAIIFYVGTRSTSGGKAMFWVWEVFHWITGVVYISFLAMYIPHLYRMREVIE